MSPKYIGVAIFALGAVLSGCKNSNRGMNENAGTPQTFPAPGINFFSEGSYNGADVDGSVYFGNRQAMLYYYGSVGIGSMNPNSECQSINKRGNSQYLAVASADLGGYSNYWKAPGTRRYSSFTAQSGDAMAQVSGWHNNQGQPFQTVRGGLHLVCLMGNSANAIPMGMFFDANPSMTRTVNVNVQFQNLSVNFSQAYFGNQFQRFSADHYNVRRGPNVCGQNPCRPNPCWVNRCGNPCRPRSCIQVIPVPVPAPAPPPPPPLVLPKVEPPEEPRKRPPPLPPEEAEGNIK